MLSGSGSMVALASWPLTKKVPIRVSKAPFLLPSTFLLPLLHPKKLRQLFQRTSLPSTQTHTHKTFFTNDTMIAQTAFLASLVLAAHGMTSPSFSRSLFASLHPYTVLILSLMYSQHSRMCCSHFAKGREGPSSLPLLHAHRHALD